MKPEIPISNYHIPEINHSPNTPTTYSDLKFAHPPFLPLLTLLGKRRPQNVEQIMISGGFHISKSPHEPSRLYDISNPSLIKASLDFLAQNSSWKPSPSFYSPTLGKVSIFPDTELIYIIANLTLRKENLLLIENLHKHLTSHIHTSLAQRLQHELKHSFDRGIAWTSARNIKSKTVHSVLEKFSGLNDENKDLTDLTTKVITPIIKASEEQLVTMCDIIQQSIPPIPCESF